LAKKRAQNVDEIDYRCQERCNYVSPIFAQKLNCMFHLLFTCCALFFQSYYQHHQSCFGADNVGEIDKGSAQQIAELKLMNQLFALELSINNLCS